MLLPLIIYTLATATIVSDTPRIITLEEDNHLALTGEINRVLIDKTIINLNRIHRKEIYVYINSVGGSVDEGERLIAQMQYRQAFNTTFTCIAEVAHSMAFYLMQRCDTRLVTSGAKMMQHQISVVNAGQLRNLESHMAMIRSTANRIYQACADRIGIPLKLFVHRTTSDWWLYGQEIVDQNVADGIAIVGCSPSLQVVSVGLSHKVEYSNLCPMVYTA
jgi:ATP-dependent protease ClpP protease subunit